MSRIVSADSAAIIDSRGPTDGRGDPPARVRRRGRAGAPSGASTGVHEVRAFPEGGALEALKRFPQKVAPRLVGVDAADRSAVDAALHAADGTADFSADRR